MAECYRRLTEHMTDDGLQVLMFTHKSTDVWEDLRDHVGIWASGQTSLECCNGNTWSRDTHRKLRQATYNMVLRKRNSEKGGLH